MMIPSATRIQFKLATKQRPIRFGDASPSNNIERTFVALKPDGVERQLLPEVLKRFYDKGLNLVGLKLMQFPPEAVQNFYGHHADKAFYKGLVNDYMQRGPIVAMVWEGPNAVKTALDLTGPTKPEDAKAGTIRGDYAWYKKDDRIDTVQENIVHRSDDPANGEKELKYFFKENEIMPAVPLKKNNWLA